MKMKKLLVSVLALLMVFSSLQMVAFAEEAPTEDALETNFDVDVMLWNRDCLEYEALKNAELSITLTKNDDPAVTVSVPLAYDAEFDSISAAAYIESEAMQTILDDLSAKQKALLDAELKDALEDEVNEPAQTLRMMKNKLAEVEDEAVENILDGYTVTLNGMPNAEHYQTEFTASVINGDTVIYVFELMKGMMESLLEDEGVTADLQADSYVGMMDEIAKLTGFESYKDALLAEGYTEEERALYESAFGKLVRQEEAI